ncbi:uncharacterized protein BDZ83DRAFT_646515 [Colletotrichum acutatum]|uniref:Uncharacterized protein n=1 Tax=Glomerella acutata TaxID=27357 RepID=A0AAD8XPE2_GLOAC|nr:uncharacterized protein BDZ83DRAFT_646515 [Colletotrichum acutatum]KAK1731089.1 hypothetical protein BDZ83DRAFT_646515 [Colletotrichum acutatum]
MSRHWNSWVFQNPCFLTIFTPQELDQVTCMMEYLFACELGSREASVFLVLSWVASWTESPTKVQVYVSVLQMASTLARSPRFEQLSQMREDAEKDRIRRTAIRNCTTYDTGEPQVSEAHLLRRARVRVSVFVANEGRALEDSDGLSRLQADRGEGDV